MRCKRSRDTAHAKWEESNPAKVQRCVSKRPAVDPITQYCQNKYGRGENDGDVTESRVLTTTDEVMLALDLFTGPSDGVT